jgi:hypothetical protein
LNATSKRSVPFSSTTTDAVFSSFTIASTPFQNRYFFAASARRGPGTPIVVAERRRERDRVTGSSTPRARSRRPRRAGARHAVRRDRIRDVCVLHLVEEARRRRGPGEGRYLPIVGEARPERLRICGVFSAPPATTIVLARIVPPSTSTPVARPPSITTRSTGESARSSSSPRAQVSAIHVFAVFLPAFVGQPWRHEPQCMQLASV